MSRTLERAKWQWHTNLYSETDGKSLVLISTSRIELRFETYLCRKSHYPRYADSEFILFVYIPAI